MKTCHRNGVTYSMKPVAALGLTFEDLPQWATFVRLNRNNQKSKHSASELFGIKRSDRSAFFYFADGSCGNHEVDASHKVTRAKIHMSIQYEGLESA